MKGGMALTGEAEKAQELASGLLDLGVGGELAKSFHGNIDETLVYHPMMAVGG